MNKGKQISHNISRTCNVNISYLVLFCETGENISLDPDAIESCMNPGVFTVKPVLCFEDDRYIHLSNNNTSIDIHKEDLENKKVIIKTKEFTPVIYRKMGVCINCTNCGQCSY